MYHLLINIRNSFLLLLFVFLSIVCFSQTTTQSKRLTKPVTIDGSAKEWQNPFGLYETKTKLMFAISNDDSTLYLCFQCPDPVNQDKIMQAGMQVSINTKGKNKVNASIQFPFKKTDKKNKSEEIISEYDYGIDGLKASFLLNNFTMLTEGFATQNGTFHIKESRNIQIAMNWDSINTLVYELAIPYKELFGNAFAVADLSKEITLGVEIFAVAQPSIENYNLNGLNTNNAASVTNNGYMQQYGTTNTMGDMQNGNQGSGQGMNGMPTQNPYMNNGMAGMNSQQGNGAAWDGNTPPQYSDISGMFERAEMKQKFILSVAP